MASASLRNRVSRIRQLSYQRQPAVTLRTAPTFNVLRDQELTPAALLNTHGHPDHIAGNTALKEAFPEAPLLIGAGDAPMLTDANLNLSAAFGTPITSPPADRTVREGDVFEEAGIRLEVLEIPGHSLGHVVFVHRSSPIFLSVSGIVMRRRMCLFLMPFFKGSHSLMDLLL